MDLMHSNVAWLTAGGAMGTSVVRLLRRLHRRVRMWRFQQAARVFFADFSRLSRRDKARVAARAWDRSSLLHADPMVAEASVREALRRRWDAMDHQGDFDFAVLEEDLRGLLPKVS